MNLFDTSKSIIENVYLVSGPVLAIFGIFAIRQITLLKEQIKIARDGLNQAQKQLTINSKRDSIKLSAEQVNFYMDTIVKYSNESFIKYKELGISRVSIKTTRFIKSDVLSSPNVKEIHEFLRRSEEIALLDLKVMNALETFSTYFVQKVADENAAFQAVGASFCDTVETLSLFFSICRFNESTRYVNTITLYRLWKNRVDRETLESQKKLVEKELTAKIEELQAKIKITPETDIHPLGTD